MAFTACVGTRNGGNSNTPAVSPSGGAPSEGQVVCAVVNMNSTSTIVDAGSNDWENPVKLSIGGGQSAVHSLWWKIAGASEPTQYSWTMGEAEEWEVVIFVGTADDDIVLDSPANTHLQTSQELNLVCGAANGRTIANLALSLIYGAKDNRGSADQYDTADNSYTGVVGEVENQAAGGAYRIYGADEGETFSGDITISGAVDPSDFTYSIHISFVEDSGDITGSGAAQCDDSSTSGTAEREITCTGTLVLGASSVAGVAALQLKILLTAAQGRELRDEDGDLVASLANIAYEWYDKDTDTDGDPDATGTFSTDASGEATIQLPSTTLSSGQFGLLILEHPTDNTIRGIYRIPVS